MSNTKNNKYAQKIFTEDYPNIVKLYQDGYSVRKIAKKYGVVHSTITNILIKENVFESGRKIFKIPEGEHSNLISMYTNDGMYQYELAELYGVSKPTIGNILRYYNVDTSDHVRKSQFSDDDVQYMYHLYIDENYSSYDIAKIYNVDSTEILLLFKKNGYDTKSFSVANRKYNINENYFDKIDTQNKAYFLGLLWSDGCNFVKKNAIILSLQETDKHILDSFNKEIESNRPLRFENRNDKNPNWKNAYILRINNEHMSHVLESYGMVQNKSLILEFPKKLPKELYPHFIRGYFDGDGCIPYSMVDYSTNMVGTKEVLSEFQKILDKQGIKATLRIHTNNEKNTYVLRTNSKLNSKLFLDYIYHDSELYLYRKMDLYKKKYCA